MLQVVVDGNGLHGENAELIERRCLVLVGLGSVGVGHGKSLARGDYHPNIRWLVVHAHPDPDSYSAALREAAVRGLRSAGHEVETLDLYALDFIPWMEADEHRDYETRSADHPDSLVAQHIELVRWAEAMVFVFPTWWGSLPAMLKGWLDRVLLPGVAFTLDDKTRKVEPSLKHIRRLVGITTYGAPRWQAALLGDGGKTTIGRTVRLVCRRTCRVTWLSLDRLDGRSDEERAAFLAEVDQKMSGF